jgi:glyoxylase-like metal-dependent hydrolase (beta-lactamase superfamily II)
MTMKRYAATPLALLIAALAFGTTAHAAAPLAKAGAPGYTRVLVGDFEVTPVSDGVLELPIVDLLHNDKAKTRAALDHAHLTNPVTTSVNTFLVNTGTKLVLVDTGAGALFGPTLGKLLDNIKASGYQPEQIDDILITHLHPDHVGGLMAAGKVAFPNAVIHADQRDADYWLSEANLAKAPKDQAGFFQGAIASLSPYVKAGKFKPFSKDGEVVPGFKAVATPGHTPGHTVYVAESKGKKLVFIGDLIHVGSVQFDHPDITIGFDSDAKQAYAARSKEFAVVAKEGDLVAAAHLQFPGLGYIRANGKAWTWIPANYAPRP